MTGRIITKKLPEFVQLDFEAFYSLNPAEFIQKVMPMMAMKEPASDKLKYWASIPENVEVTPDIAGDINNNNNNNNKYNNDNNNKKFIKVGSLFNTTASILFALSNLEIYGEPILPGEI